MLYSCLLMCCNQVGQELFEHDFKILRDRDIHPSERMHLRKRKEKNASFEKRMQNMRVESLQKFENAERKRQSLRYNEIGLSTGAMTEKETLDFNKAWNAIYHTAELALMAKDKNAAVGIMRLLVDGKLDEVIDNLTPKETADAVDTEAYKG
jgi:hypothetical protein